MFANVSAEFTAPVAFSSTYCTMLEHFLSNLLPILLGVEILGAHWSDMVLFFCSLEMGTLSTHSGYNLPWNFNALQHDWHQQVVRNFSAVGAQLISSRVLQLHLYGELWSNW